MAQDVVYDQFEQEVLEKQELVKKNFWHKIKSISGKVPFIPDAVSLYFCAMDVKTPTQMKVIALGALAYLIYPGDAIPDFIPVWGHTDDAAVIFGALGKIGSYVTQEHREKARDWLDGKPVEI